MNLGRIGWGMLLAVAYGLFACWPDAHATAQLALECFSSTPATTPPATCPQGWTWHTPAAGAVVRNQAGAARVFVTPATAEPIELCLLDLSPGAAESACGAAYVFYGSGTIAAGQIKTDAKPPTITWKNPTINTDDSPLTNLDHVDVYRFRTVDASDVTDATKPWSAFGGHVATTFTDATATAGLWCYFLKAVTDAGVSSERSGIACKIVAAPPATNKPGPPYDIAIQ